MNLEKPSEHLELGPEYRIRGCLTLDELYLVLRDVGEIQGEKRLYNADDIEKMIGHIATAAQAHRDGIEAAVNVEMDGVTRALGLRDKVRSLIAKLPITE